MKRKFMVRIRYWQVVLGLSVGLVAVVLGSMHTYRHPRDAIPVVTPITIPVEGRRELPEGPGFARDKAKQAQDVFYRMLDSLKADAHGRAVYDSLLLARPGLLDSARRMEGLFK